MENWNLDIEELYQEIVSDEEFARMHDYPEIEIEE